MLAAIEELIATAKVIDKRRVSFLERKAKQREEFAHRFEGSFQKSGFQIKYQILCFGEFSFVWGGIYVLAVSVVATNNAEINLPCLYH